MGSRAAGIRTGDHMGSRRDQEEDFSRLAISLLFILYMLAANKIEQAKGVNQLESMWVSQTELSGRKLTVEAEVGLEPRRTTGNMTSREAPCGERKQRDKHLPLFHSSQPSVEIIVTSLFFWNPVVM